MLDTRYDDNQRFYEGGLDIGGNEFPNAPNVSGALGFDWTVWGNGDRGISLHGDMQHMGSYWFDPYNDYGKNLTNEFYWSYGLNLNAFYLDYFARGAPRMYGLEATVNF